MATQVNLHPQRRQPKAQTETRLRTETGTSRFFAPSMPRDDTEMIDATPRMAMAEDQDEDASTEEEDEGPKKRMRQMRLDFSNGILNTKKPFRNPLSRQDDARKKLAHVAAETISLLPGLLRTRPDVGTDGYLCQKEAIDAKFCPKLPPVKVRVISSDTIDAALDLQGQSSNQSGQKPVAILNMANAKSAGGGWRHGALAQEEAICYRSSLCITLKRRFYPIPDDAAIYSPRVLVIRDSIRSGHQVVDCTEPKNLDVIAVISCAAVCQPSTKKDANSGLRIYALAQDKRLMMEKMRIILRTAIRNRHQQLVLGALGCGAFGNPNTEVAEMWKVVLEEQEFSGGWWKDIVFAVLGDSKADSNFKVFHDELDSLVLK